MFVSSANRKTSVHIQIYVQGKEKDPRSNLGAHRSQFQPNLIKYHQFQPVRIGLLNKFRTNCNNFVLNHNSVIWSGKFHD